MTVKIKDRGAKRVVAEIGKAHKHPVRVGVIGDDADEEYDDTGVTVAMVGEWAEFGIGQPQRSWLRAWIDENKNEIRKVATVLQRNVIKGRMTERQANAALGEWAAAKIRDRIAKGIAPPNAESTIAKKGSSTPLINFGQFRSSITSQVDG